MSQQDPLNSAAQRREVVIATLAAAVHRWHRERIRAGVRASRAASIAPAEFPSDPASRRGRLVYRRPISSLCRLGQKARRVRAVWRLRGLARRALGSRPISEPTGQDTGCLVMGASKSSRTLGVSG